MGWGWSWCPLRRLLACGQTAPSAGQDDPECRGCCGPDSNGGNRSDGTEGNSGDLACSGGGAGSGRGTDLDGCSAGAPRGSDSSGRVETAVAAAARPADVTGAATAVVARGNRLSLSQAAMLAPVTDDDRGTDCGGFSAASADRRVASTIVTQQPLPPLPLRILSPTHLDLHSIPPPISAAISPTTTAARAKGSSRNGIRSGWQQRARYRRHQQQHLQQYYKRGIAALSWVSSALGNDGSDGSSSHIVSPSSATSPTYACSSSAVQPVSVSAAVLMRRQRMLSNTPAAVAIALADGYSSHEADGAGCACTGDRSPIAIAAATPGAAPVITSTAARASWTRPRAGTGLMMVPGLALVSPSAAATADVAGTGSCRHLRIASSMANPRVLLLSPTNGGGGLATGRHLQQQQQQQQQQRHVRAASMLTPTRKPLQQVQQQQEPQQPLKQHEYRHANSGCDDVTRVKSRHHQPSVFTFQPTNAAAGGDDDDFGNAADGSVGVHLGDDDGRRQQRQRLSVHASTLSNNCHEAAAANENGSDPAPVATTVRAVTPSAAAAASTGAACLAASAPRAAASFTSGHHQRGADQKHDTALVVTAQHNTHVSIDDSHPAEATQPDASSTGHRPASTRSLHTASSSMSLSDLCADDTDDDEQQRLLLLMGDIHVALEDVNVRPDSFVAPFPARPPATPTQFSPDQLAFLSLRR